MGDSEQGRNEGRSRVGAGSDGRVGAGSDFFFPIISLSTIASARMRMCSVPAVCLFHRPLFRTKDDNHTYDEHIDDPQCLIACLSTH
jgi:hypothetical protein